MAPRQVQGPQVQGMPQNLVLAGDDSPPTKSSNEDEEATEEQLQWQEAKIEARKAKQELEAAMLTLDQQTGREARAAADIAVKFAQENKAKADEEVIKKKKALDTRNQGAQQPQLTPQATAAAKAKLEEKRRKVQARLAKEAQAKAKSKAMASGEHSPEIMDAPEIEVSEGETEEELRRLAERVTSQTDRSHVAEVRLESLEAEQGGRQVDLVNLPQWAETSEEIGRPTKLAVTDATWQALRETRPGLLRQIQDLDFNKPECRARICFFQEDPSVAVPHPEPRKISRSPGEASGDKAGAILRRRSHPQVMRLAAEADGRGVRRRNAEANSDEAARNPH